MWFYIGSNELIVEQKNLFMSFRHESDILKLKNLTAVTEKYKTKYSGTFLSGNNSIIHTIRYSNPFPFSETQA